MLSENLSLELANKNGGWNVHYGFWPRGGFLALYIIWFLLCKVINILL